MLYINVINIKKLFLYMFNYCRFCFVGLGLQQFLINWLSKTKQWRQKQTCWLMDCRFGENSWEAPSHFESCAGEFVGGLSFPWVCSRLQRIWWIRESENLNVSFLYKYPHKHLYAYYYWPICTIVRKTN